MIPNDTQMIMTAIDDVAASRRIHAIARARRIPINCADMPPECDFYFGSQIRRGPLQVMVSTGGKGPKLANIIRRRLEDSLPDNVESAIERVGELRAALRKRAPGVGGKVGQQRMEWMVKVCETWSLAELGELDKQTIQFLLDEGWSRGQVMPKPGNKWKRLSLPSARSMSTPEFALGIGSGLLLSMLGMWCIRRPTW